MNKTKVLLTNSLNRFKLGRLFLAHYLLHKNFLSDLGWNRSVCQKQPIDRNNNPIPWFTYSFISFLQPRIQPGLSIFEFGSGNSTLWFSSLSCNIISVEHDRKWHERMKLRFQGRPNIRAILAELQTKAYSNVILDYDNEFDIIVIDGRDRVRCCQNSLKALKKSGVIIWDNSEREEYSDGYRFLEENGFLRLDFFGFGPINSKAWCTSVFYKRDNVLKI